MTDMYGAIFVLQFLVLIGLFIYKLVNVMSMNKTSSFLTSFVVFIGFIIAYLIGFVTMLVDYEEMLIAILFRIESFLLLLFVGLFIMEIAINFINVNKPITAYDGQKQKERYGR